MIPPARVPVRHRRRRIHDAPLPLPADAPPAPPCRPMADITLEPGGMVEVALYELGARLVRVQQEPTSDI